MSTSPPPASPALPPFDPRQVAVTDTGADLPAVEPARLLPAALQRRFAAPPAWQPELHQEKRFTERAMAYASVLVPLVLRGADGSQPTVLLTQRTAHLSSHSGQIAFPGGKADAGDHDATETALREAEEEVGLARQHVEVIGQMPVYVTGSAYIITPVVALVRADFALRPNPFEVADAFEVPLSFLMNPAHHRRHVMTWQGVQREWFSMPYPDAQHGERFIWGATAGMLRNLYRFLSA